MILVIVLLLVVFILLPAAVIGGVIGGAIAGYKNKRLIARDAQTATIRAEAYRIPPRTNDIVQCESKNG